MQGASWTDSSGWGNVAVSHCDWVGVLCCNYSTSKLPSGDTCSSPGAVLAVALPLNNLQGTIPSDFLTNLQSLYAVDLRGTHRHYRFIAFADYI